MVWHLGGGTLPPTSPFKLKLNFRNNMLALEKNLPGTYVTSGFSQTRAERKAANFLRMRVFLDFCARIVYFCIGKPQLARAVRDAHREWKDLRKHTPVIHPPVHGAKVAGLTHKLIFFN